MVDTIADELTAGFDAVPVEVAVIRILSALVLSGLIGAEREWRERPAGLRTHMLVALAACLYVIVATEIVTHDVLGAGEQLRVDPMNLIGAVTAGVAFLVAGIIITSGGKVKNVTTGASLWLAGAIGLAAGAGSIPLAALATVLVVGVLMLVSLFERPGDRGDPGD
jgi:putative Mg2+ transporter-C (MgtC) family protein